METITALQRHREQSRSMIASETVTAQQSSSCGTITVTADDSDDGGNGGDPDEPTGPGNGGDQQPGNGGVGSTDLAVIGGGVVGVALLAFLLT